ncbi:MAG: ABC transporter permease [Deltaproteobacteria bacterium]|jgi:peptide/nickel transport system permease protein|nr:ABC transporter permease [Deltaproteobacteria bacterium]MBT4637586.1 ABC transporter permease [Deltaproteobacteria bacterium]MBT6504553.1 ABC transporter permease [Deltaproteobacteria bacterium]MBT6614317.1 ABC transporter permease [Deltaproteobacteria bacterium]MBT7714330.1 ABC transporter permease [Deltaproteobacteria bacterium]
MINKHPRLQELKFTLYRIFRNPSAVIGFTLLIFFIVVAIGAPYIAPPKYPHNPYRMPHKGFSHTPKPPSKQAIFGTTSGQYDIFYGAVWGTRTAFRIGLFVVGISMLIGVALGTVSGYYGGIIDEVLMRFVDIVFAIPTLVLAMAIVVAFGRGLDKVMIALAMIGWRNYVRVMRSSILTLRELDFVQAAKIMGVSDLKIMLRHILPNGIYPVLVMAFMDIGSMVIVAAFMSFLGLGAPKGYADWGQMVALARNYIVGPPDDPLKYWFAIAIPGLCIVLFVLAWNLIGDALRDAFDPKIRRR